MTIVNAYVLAADPAWLAQSVASYYSYVDRIVVSYDRDGLSWTGTPLEVESCLAVLRGLDVENKMVFSPGRYARLDHEPLQNDTYQRQSALDEASEGADWVVQLDTDEVVADLAMFSACLDEAQRRGFRALDYPARHLHTQYADGRFLERCDRWWRSNAGYPGPVVIRAGSRLTLCRQSDVARFRVDFRPVNTDPWQSWHSPVHRVIERREAILHFSWVRSEEYMQRKSEWSGHANQGNWNPEIERWRWRTRHPWLATARTPFTRKASTHRLRPVTIDLGAFATEVARRSGDRDLQPVTSAAAVPPGGGPHAR